MSQDAYNEVCVRLDEGRMTGLQKRVIALCSLATFLDGYDLQGLGLAVPGIAQDFGIDRPDLAPALSGSLVGLALGAILLGPTADSYGRRRMLLLFMAVIGVATLGGTLATGVWSLTAWRFVSGLGMGALLPISMALAAEYAPARKRAALVALMVTASGIGAFAAGYAAPLLEAQFGWRGIFASGGATTLVATVVLFFSLPESFRFLAVHDAGSERLKRQIAVLAPEFATVDMAAAPVPRAIRPSVGALFSPELKVRSIIVFAVFWLSLFVVYSLMSWLPTLLADAGWARGDAQRAIGLLALGGIFGGLGISWLADRGYGAQALFVSYSATAVVLGLFAFGPESQAVWTGLIGLLGVGSIGSNAALGCYSATFYPSELRATGIGWSGGFGRTGAIVGPLVLAELMRGGLPSSAILGLLLLPILVCAALVTLLPRALRAGPPAGTRPR